MHQWLKTTQLFDVEVSGKRQEIKTGRCVSTFTIIINIQLRL